MRFSETGYVCVIEYMNQTFYTLVLEKAENLGRLQSHYNLKGAVS